MEPPHRGSSTQEFIHMLRRTMRARAGVVLALALAATAATVAPAQADNGKAQLAINQLSNGAYSGVNPATVVSGVNHNPGAGAPFGVDAPSKGSTNTMTFTPPANTSISGYTANVYSMSALGWPAMGTYTVLHTSWGDFNVGGNPGSIDQSNATYTGGAVGSISAGVEQATFGSGADQPGRIYLSRLAVELSDASAPTIDEAPAVGKLFGEPDASGWYTAATLPITVKASDQGLGVRYLLLKDGSTVQKYALPGTGANCATKDPDTNLYGGDTYTVKVPCPTTSAAYTVNVPLAGLGDGVHTLQLGLTDASGRTAYDSAYTTKINAPGMNPSPDGGTGLPDAGQTGPGGCTYQSDGTTCTGGGTTPPHGGGGGGGAGPTTDKNAAPISTGPTNPSSDGDGNGGTTPTIPPIEVKPINGQNATNPAALCVVRNAKGCKANSDKTITIDYGQKLGLTGRLLNSSGKPIVGAAVDIVSTSGGAHAASTTTVRTDANGIYKYVVPSGPSRTIRFGYHYQQGDTEYAGSRQVMIAVKAKLSLTPSNRLLHNGQAVVFTGKVYGASSTSKAQVEVQAQIGKNRWVTVQGGTAKIGKGGKYTARYRFERTTRTSTYKFRARVLPVSGWPYDPGYSATRTVTVRP